MDRNANERWLVVAALTDKRAPIVRGLYPRESSMCGCFRHYDHISGIRINLLDILREPVAILQCWRAAVIAFVAPGHNCIAPDCKCEHRTDSGTTTGARAPQRPPSPSQWSCSLISTTVKPVRNWPAWNWTAAKTRNRILMSIRRFYVPVLSSSSKRRWRKRRKRRRRRRRRKEEEEGARAVQEGARAGGG
eukprot:COSAG02_NODE_24_length_52386_cov_726.042898_28_plen_191_part_00